MNGIGVNESITLHTPAWLWGLRIGTGAFGVLWVVSLVIGTKRKKKFMAENPKPQKPVKV